MSFGYGPDPYSAEPHNIAAAAAREPQKFSATEPLLFEKLKDSRWLVSIHDGDQCLTSDEAPIIKIVVLDLQSGNSSTGSVRRSLLYRNCGLMAVTGDLAAPAEGLDEAELRKLVDEDVRIVEREEPSQTRGNRSTFLRSCPSTSAPFDILIRCHSGRSRSTSAKAKSVASSRGRKPVESFFYNCTDRRGAAVAFREMACSGRKKILTPGFFSFRARREREQKREQRQNVVAPGKEAQTGAK